MPAVRVVPLPSLLEPADLTDRIVIVFDVLRATSTIAAALHAGANGVQVYGSIVEARQAAAPFAGRVVLAGEERCLPPAGFDLGNSPAHFTADRVERRTIFLSTTNGTRALVAARSAAVLLTGSIVNAQATARVAARTGLPVTLLCSGTDGQWSVEDLIGCAEVLSHLPDAAVEGDAAYLATAAWQAGRDDLIETFRQCQAGRHLLNAKLADDIDFCARADRFDVACRVHEANGQLIVRAVKCGEADF